MRQSNNNLPGVLMTLGGVLVGVIITLAITPDHTTDRTTVPDELNARLATLEQANGALGARLDALQALLPTLARPSPWPAPDGSPSTAHERTGTIIGQPVGADPSSHRASVSGIIGSPQPAIGSVPANESLMTDGREAWQPIGDHDARDWLTNRGEP